MQHQSIAVLKDWTGQEQIPLKLKSVESMKTDAQRNSFFSVCWKWLLVKNIFKKRRRQKNDDGVLLVNFNCGLVDQNQICGWQSHKLCATEVSLRRATSIEASARVANSTGVGATQASRRPRCPLMPPLKVHYHRSKQRRRDCTYNYTNHSTAWHSQLFSSNDL